MLVGIDPGVHFMETDLQTEQVFIGEFFSKGLVVMGGGM